MASRRYCYHGQYMSRRINCVKALGLVLVVTYLSYCYLFYLLLIMILQHISYEFNFVPEIRLIGTNFP